MLQLFAFFILLFFTVSNKLTLLETLDKTNFNLSGILSCVDELYEKIFDKDPHEITEVGHLPFQAEGSLRMWCYNRRLN